MLLGPWFGVFCDGRYKENGRERRWEVQYFVGQSDDRTFAGTGRDEVGEFTMNGTVSEGVFCKIITDVIVKCNLLHYLTLLTIYYTQNQLRGHRVSHLRYIIKRTKGVTMVT